MGAKHKSFLVIFLVVAAVLIENYVVYSCMFDGKRDYIDLLLCGVLVHCIVALIVWLNLWAIIPVDKAVVKQCNNVEDNKAQSRQEGKADGKAIPPTPTLEAKSDNAGLQKGTSIAGSNKCKTQTGPIDTKRTLPITKAKSDVEGESTKNAAPKPSVANQKVASRVAALDPMDMIAPVSAAPPMMILQDQRSWMASDLRKDLMFDFELKESLNKVLRRKGVSEDIFYLKIASASLQLHVSMHELINKLRIIQRNPVAMETVVSAILQVDIMAY